jgi:hypothetical protein
MAPLALPTPASTSSAPGSSISAVEHEDREGRYNWRGGGCCALALGSEARPSEACDGKLCS